MVQALNVGTKAKNHHTIVSDLKRQLAKSSSTQTNASITAKTLSALVFYVDLLFAALCGDLFVHTTH